MEDNNLIHKFVRHVKSKFTKNSKGYPSVTEYAFSSEEIEKISKQNKQKILDLKQDGYPREVKKEESVLKTLDKMKVENVSVVESTDGDVSSDKDDLEEKFFSKEETLVEDKEVSENPALKEKEKLEEKVEENSKQPMHSFVSLNSDNQKIVMENWNAIDIREIDKDIMDGKEILSHNYVITYADEAEKFIHDIRKKYEIVVCYLIGFNNEKKGIFDKTIFSSKMDDEWKFLGQYIKILEKIRNFKK